MSRAAEITAEKFFEKALPHSIAKANIVADYAIGWAKIIINSRISSNRNPNKQIQLDEKAYFIDLCCGAGAYDDGEESTPLKIIRGALKIDNVKNNLLLYFNDISKEMISRLRKNIDSINGLDFHYPIKYDSLNAASDEIMNRFKRNAARDKIPTLVFIDPFGYKEISQELLRTIISVPQSDIIIFFNYKRINPALENSAPGFESNMDRLFGVERVQKIKIELETTKSAAREELILKHLEAALKDIGAEYVCPYLVVPEDETHTSHYVVCMSKHHKGFELMKSVMSQHSNIGKSAKSKFGYDPASVVRDNQGSLFDKPIDSAEVLAKQLAQKFSGRTLTYGELYDKHQRTAQYTRPEYRQAVQLLFQQGLAKPVDSNASRIVNGVQTTPPHLQIEFL